MYPTATRYPGPANASTLRNQLKPGAIGIVRCASGRDGSRAGTAPAIGARPASTEGSASINCSVVRGIFKFGNRQKLTMVNTLTKLSLTESSVNRSLLRNVAGQLLAA